MSEVKKMLFINAGESHSMGVRYGLNYLEAAYPAYAVNVKEGGVAPEAYTTAYLRACNSTWGDVNNASGWIAWYGEEDWSESALGISRTKASITYCNTHGYVLSAFGFSWCYDPMPSYNYVLGNYLVATQQYIDYCAAQGYATKIFFATGPVDEIESYGYGGYLEWVRSEQIRDYVKANSSRILFDYGDILSYDDGSNTPNTATYNGHTFPVITATNLGAADVAHISQAGCLDWGKQYGGCWQE